MKLSEVKQLLASVVAYNLEQFERGASHNTFVVPFLVGDPGVGKTAAPKQVAKEAEISYFQTIVAQFDPGELAGLPFMGERAVEFDEAGNATRHETRMVRLRPSYLPDISNEQEHVGIYNLDELPQAMLAGQNVMSQLVNEWRIGEHHISHGITICCTGNKPENKAGTTAMPTHLKDRLTFINIDVDHDEWLAYANAVGVDPVIRAYIRKVPQSLHNFSVGSNANPTPRSWEKASAILSMGLPSHIRLETLAGQIGQGEATQFEQYIRVQDRMPDPHELIRRPNDAQLFTNKDADILYLLLTSLADLANANNIEAILTYIDRMPNKEWAAVFTQDAFSRDKSLLNVKSVTRWKMTSGAKLML